MAQRGTAAKPGRVRSASLLEADLRQANERLVLAAMHAEQLAQAAEGARALLEALPDVIVRFDPQLRWVYANAAVEPLARRPRSALLGKTNAEVGAPPAFVERADALLAEAFATGAVGEAFLELRLHDEWRRFHFRTVAERGIDGAVTSVLGIARDVTESALYQQAREDADRLRRLQSVTAAFSEARTPAEVSAVLLAQGREGLRADAGAVMLLGENGDRLQLTAAVGYEADVMARWPWIPVDSALPIAEVVRSGEVLFFATPELAAARYPTLREHSAPGDHAVLAVPLSHHDRTVGALVLVFRSARAFDKDDQEFVVALALHAAHAIERTRLLEAETRARREAEAASRLKDEFLATVSHELRTPLNAVVGWSSLLSTRADDPVLLRRGLEAIQRNARAQTRLVEDVLDISRITSGKLRLEIAPTDVGTVVRAAVDIVRAAADAKRIELRIAIADVVVVPADADRVQQMLWNLLINSVKFTPEGGSIDVTLEARGPSVIIEVRDTGRGIDVAFLPHVFERFRQHDGSIRREHGGLGLGLAIVRQLAELHGGSARAESEGSGRGACFTIELPTGTLAGPSANDEHRASDELGSSTSPEALAEARELLGIRVLIVDDDPDARDVCSLALQARGAIVVCAGSAEGGLVEIASFAPDVVVCDLGMPAVDGYSFARTLRGLPLHAGSGTPAIALSGYVRSEDKAAAAAAGFQAHLEKPVSFHALSDAIRRLRSLA